MSLWEVFARVVKKLLNAIEKFSDFASKRAENFEKFAEMVSYGEPEKGERRSRGAKQRKDRGESKSEGRRKSENGSDGWWIPDFEVPDVDDGLKGVKIPDVEIPDIEVPGVSLQEFAQTAGKRRARR